MKSATLWVLLAVWNRVGKPVCGLRGRNQPARLTSCGPGWANAGLNAIAGCGPQPARAAAVERDMKSLILAAAGWLFLGVAVVQAQVAPPIDGCGPRGCDPPIQPASAPPPSTGVPIDRAKPSNQTGMGTVFSATIPTGGAATVQGSSSYTYSVPLFSKPGRAGMDLNLTLYYNSHIWIPDPNGGMLMGFDRNTPAPGFQLNLGFVEWNVTGNGPPGILTTPDGAKHTLALDPSNLVLDTQNNVYRCLNQICLYDTDDSSYIHVSQPLGTFDGSLCSGPNNCPAKDITVTYKNGTQAVYQSFAVVTNDILDEFVMRPYKITDSNGNFTTISYLNGNDLNISAMTDSVGRTLNFFYTSVQVSLPGQAAQTVPLLNCVTDGATCGASGARTYTFTWDQAHAINFNFSLPSQVLVEGQLAAISSGFAMPVLTQVCRPDTTCVKFNYGDWGIVNDIQEQSNTGMVRYELSYDFPTSAAGQLGQNPTYARQSETINGQTNVWTFSNNFDANGLITSSVIQDPTGLTETTNFSRNGDWQDGLPTKIVTDIARIDPCVFSCQPLLTRNLSWASDLAMAQSGITNGGYNTGKNPRLASVTTILDDGSQSQVSLQYDNSATPVGASPPAAFVGSGSITDKIETDLGATGPGPVLRETITAYKSLSGHILGLPTDIQVKDGNGKVFSHTTMSYDEGGVQSVSPLPSTGHDNVNYSSTSTISRGNLTSTTTYADPVGNNGGVTSTYTYDMLGNRTSAKLGCTTCSQTTWNYSSATQYAYPDSVVVGQTGNQLTTSYTYDQSTGKLSTVTDPNGQVTTYHFDTSGRPGSVTTPDNVTVTFNYDDSSANPAVTTLTTANSNVTTHTTDFLGHAVSDQVLNGTAVVSTVSYLNDAKGRPLQVSNPYGPQETPVYTVNTYDRLGRPFQSTPPAAATGGAQNPYITSTTGATTQFTDPAGMQHKEVRDGLGRVVQVVRPGPSGGSFATGTLTLPGSELSVASSSSSNGATAGTGSVSINWATGGTSDRTATVVKSNATPAKVNVSIGGQNGTDSSVTTICRGVPPKQTCTSTTRTFADLGYMQFSVNVGGTVITSAQVPYSNSSTVTQASLAQGLANALPANSLVSAVYNGDNSFTLTTAATGSSANTTSLSTSIASTNCDPAAGTDSIQYSCQQSWIITPSQNFAGGTDQVTSTVSDTGKVTVSITASNGTIYSKQSVYGQGSSPTSVALDLYNQFNGDPTVTAVLRMTQPGTGGFATNTVGFTTVAAGANTNYALSASSATSDTTDFGAGSTSFPITASGATFTAGQNGTLFDQGTVTLSVTGFTSTGTPPSKQVAYGQGSNAPSLAAQLASLVHNDSSFPLDASAAAGSAIISFTARTPGAAANDLGVTLSGTSSLSASFPTPSFASPGVSTNMANGADQTFSMDPSVAIVTNYGYDPLGNVRSVKRNQQTQTYVYDGLGRRTSAATPETAGQAVSYTYKDFGGVATKTDPRIVPGTSNNVTTTYGYDTLNRIKAITYNDNVTLNVTYTYNAPSSANNTGGRLASVSNSVEEKDYQYDVMGRITQCLETIGTNSYTVGYGYAADGQLGSITYPSNLKVNYNYDSIGRLQQISTPTQGILSINSADYNAAGMASTITYGNGIAGKFGYNSQLQLSSLQYGSASGASLFSLGYSYGGAANNGQIQAITDNVDSTRSTSYQYDPLGRLQMAQTADQTSANSWKLGFAYDRDGNRLAETPAGGSAAMPSSFVAVDPTTNRIQGSGTIYDEAGNMLSDGLNNNLFDAKNRLVSTSPVPGLGGSPSTFAYGPTSELINRNGTYYIYAAGQVIAEYANGAAAGSPSVQYVNLGGNQVANIAGGTVTFNFADHLSTRVIADLSGTPVRTYGHFPAGETFYQTGAASDFQFTTYRRDANSGLDYANARFYSARLGRFVSADLLLGGNRYAYGNGDAINTVDPSGNISGCIGSANACGPGCGIVCIGFGGLGGAPDTSCALCGETLGLPAGMKIEPQTLGDLLKEALGIPDLSCNPWSERIPMSDGCGLKNEFLNPASLPLSTILAAKAVQDYIQDTTCVGESLNYRPMDARGKQKGPLLCGYSYECKGADHPIIGAASLDAIINECAEGYLLYSNACPGLITTKSKMVQYKWAFGLVEAGAIVGYKITGCEQAGIGVTGHD